MRNITIFFFYFFLLSQSVFGQEIQTIESPNIIYNISSHVEYFRDSTSQIGLKEITTKPFTQVPYDFLNINATYDFVWTRFSIKTPLPEIFLLLDDVQFKHLELYKEEKGELIWIKTIGSAYPSSNKDLNINGFAFRLPTTNQEPSVFYLKIENETPIRAIFKIGTAKALFEYRHPIDFFFGFFVGYLCLIIFYNIYSFSISKDKSYIFYSFFLISAILFNVESLHGYFSDFFYEKLFLYPETIPGIGSLFFSTLFNIYFLNIRKSLPFFYKVGIGLLVLCLILFLIALFGNTVFVIGGMQLTSLLSSIYIITTGIILWVRGYEPARLYVLGWGLFSIGLVLFIVKDYNLLPINFFMNNILILASIAEITFLTLALADRMNFFRKEQERVQAENLRIQKEANTILEQKVKERTAQLQEANEELNQTLEVVEQERKKSDNLLLNVLPMETAQELKEKGFTTPKHLKKVTVLFTDFKGFTQSVESLPPQEVIKELDLYFNKFDEIFSKYSIERIKTIGDSYMAAGGVPTKNENNPIDIISAALEINDFMQEASMERKTEGKPVWGCRIGVHTGEVIAGVVGTKRFAYDIWGDTVNIASRMESSGEVGKINISGDTYELVKHVFKCSYRGKIDAKNKGQLDMYFVEGKF